jgi:hypothetical protein
VVIFDRGGVDADVVVVIDAGCMKISETGVGSILESLDNPRPPLNGRDGGGRDGGTLEANGGTGEDKIWSPGEDP